MSSTALKVMALKSNIKKEIEELFNTVGKGIDELEETGTAAVLIFRINGKFEEASVRFSKKDILHIELWARNPSAYKIPGKKYAVTLTENLFLFNRYLNKRHTKIILIGLLLQKTNDLRLLTNLVLTRQLNEDLAIQLKM